MIYFEGYAPAMNIQTQEEADAYLEKLVTWCITRSDKTRGECERTQRSNLAY